MTNQYIQEQIRILEDKLLQAEPFDAPEYIEWENNVKSHISYLKFILNEDQ